MQVVRGHIPAAVARSETAGVLPASNQLHLTLALPLRNREALTNFLQDIYKPGSAYYRHYLTPEQFAERFAPPEKDYQAAIAFAKSKGLTVTATHPNRTLLDVTGSVAAIEKAFHLRLRTYRHPSEARTFYAPDNEPSLDLAVPILSISGLDDFIRPRPMNLKIMAADLGVSMDKVTNSTPYATGSGPRGNFIGKDFRAAYAPGLALDGSGESLGIFALDGYYPSDIAAYERLAGLPDVAMTNVLLNGVTGQPGNNNVEVALDIEMAISMAPGLARVIVYEGDTPNDIYNRMATDNQARQLSCSWGFGPQVDPAREQIFQQFAAQGQSMFQASGDLGACSSAVFPPSDDPFLTVVGGTTLTTLGSGQWSSESAWSESGGGISKSYPIPDWQQGISMATNLGSPAMRNYSGCGGRG